MATRPNTAPRRNDNGTTTYTVKRHCNGCDRQLGDATDHELNLAADGRELPDVRSECPHCTRRARAEKQLADGLTELFDIHQLAPGDRLGRDAVEQLAEDLRDHAARIDPHRAYDSDRYPVIVDVTQRYVLWLEADSADDAIADLQEDGAWYEHLDGQVAITAWHEVAAPDGYDLRSDVYTEPFGPARQCPDCKRPPYATGVLHVVHERDCPTYLAA